ncbi:MAG: GntR family transcriptional regulator [Victivallaceae bacterium]|nr:GntR family transcriptional regulator [Victivallaceae bacterium]
MLQQTIEKNNGISKHIQLKKIAMKMICNNYATGNRFLSERELMKQFKVSSTTVSKAMKALVAEDILERRIGGGTFIKDVNKIKLTPGEYNNHPVLLFGISYRQSMQEMFAINGFIYNYIQNEIINNYPGKVFFKDTPEILKLAATGEAVRTIMLNPTQKEFEELQTTSASYVIIAQNQDKPPLQNSICWECVTGIYQLMAHFIGFGHTKIALIVGKPKSQHHRIEAFKFSLNSFGIQLHDEYLIQGDYLTTTDGYQAMQILLALPNPPTAVFVSTDLKAEGAIKAVLDSGLRVPEDISIAGFDDIPGAYDFEPPLTTIRAPYSEMGAEAVKMLDKIIQDKRPQNCKVLQTKLIIRETTGLIKSPVAIAKKHSKN